MCYQKPHKLKFLSQTKVLVDSKPKRHYRILKCKLLHMYWHNIKPKLPCYRLSAGSIYDLGRKTVSTILSHASEAGSPTNRTGSDKTRGQGSFGPSTGGHLTIDELDYYLDKIFKKETNRILDSPFLLRQGEPGTSQHIRTQNDFLIPPPDH